MPASIANYVKFVTDFKQAIMASDAVKVSEQLSFLDKINNLSDQPDYCSSGIIDSYPPRTILQQDGSLYCIDQWDAILTAYMKLIASLKQLDFKQTIDHSGTLVTEMSKCASKSHEWICLPLMTVTSELRKLVFIYIRSDTYKKEKAKKLRTNSSNFDLMLDEKLASVLQRPFKVCLSDKSDEKTFAVYFFANELFRTYLKFDKYDAANNLCKVLQHSRNAPPLSSVPKSQSITYRYYMAIVDCMNYTQLEHACKFLNEALISCPRSNADGDVIKNRMSIAILLLPLNFLLYRQIPTKKLWDSYPDLKQAFSPVFEAIKQGNLKAYDYEVASLTKLLLTKHIYALYMKIRPFVELRLFSKVIHFYNGPRKHIIPLSEFATALRYSSGRDYTPEEVESQLATEIACGRIKGYISHGNKVIVLSKKEPLPSLVSDIPSI